MFYIEWVGHVCQLYMQCQHVKIFNLQNMYRKIITYENHNTLAIYFSH